MIHAYEGKTPDVEKALFIAWNAEIAGDVILEQDSSVWFGAVLRGDIGPIRVGPGTNIQDGAVLHCDQGETTSLGRYVTVGHGAVIHSCTVKDYCIVGMGAIILNNAEIGSNCVVGAGSLVTGGKVFPEGSLIIGSPARAVRKLTSEELAGIKKSAELYIERSKKAQKNYQI